MATEIHFRKVLPLIHTVVAMVLGGWGLWLRNSILSHPFLGNSTGWESTGRLHEWPWQFKFTAILNMPAFLSGGLLSGFLDFIWPGIPESVSCLPALSFVPLLWYWSGSWLDKTNIRDSNKMKQWFLLLVFTVACVVGASIPYGLGYVSFLLWGCVIWTLAIIGMIVSRVFRKHTLRTD